MSMLGFAQFYLISYPIANRGWTTSSIIFNTKYTMVHIVGAMKCKIAQDNGIGIVVECIQA